MKQWHSAKLLFEARIDGAIPADGLREESIRILQATSNEEALRRAEQLGRAAEHEYSNEAGQLARWCFVGVLEVQSLDESVIVDGTEVFSTLTRVEPH